MQDLEAAKLVLSGAIVGALAGLLGSVVLTFIASRAESKRQLLQLAFQSGMKHLELQVQAKTTGTAYPLITVEHHAEVLKLIRDRKLTPESYKGAIGKLESLMKAGEES